MEFKRSELVEWIIEDKSQLVLKRTEVPPLRLKKTAGGLLDCFQELWEQGRSRLRPGPGRGEGKKARPERAGLSGPAHGDGTCICFGAPVFGLVG